MSRTVLLGPAFIVGVTFQGLSDADEAVPDSIERSHVHVVFELLGERTGQPRVAGHMHPRAQIVALDMARRDIGPNRPGFDGALAGSDACRRVIPLRGVRHFAVNLDEPGVVHIAVESALNRFQVRLGPSVISCTGFASCAVACINWPSRSMFRIKAQVFGGSLFMPPYTYTELLCARLSFHQF